MVRQTRAKCERIIEAVRHGLEGDSAVEFIRQSGYAMTTAGVARHLRAMGGRGRVQALIREDKTNFDILQTCFPNDDLEILRRQPPSQGELFEEPGVHSTLTHTSMDVPLYETAKMSIRLPADLYEAIRLASRAEGKSQNQLIVEILTAALSRMPQPMEQEAQEAGGSA